MSACLSLALAGCSASYNGERLFWKAQQLSASIVKDPSHASAEAVAKSIEAFDRVIQQTPGTVWAARAQAAIGSLYALQKQYAKAREAYGLVLRNYSDEKTLNLSARMAIAKTYEIEERWDEALTAYQDIGQYHPWSAAGMEAPLYTALLHERRKEFAQAKSAYQAAVPMYTKLIADAPAPALATQAKGYLALVYQRLGAWDEAIAILEDLLRMPSGVNRPLVLLSLGSVYQAKGGEADKAREAYTKLTQEFPAHPFGKTAKARLEHLGLRVEVPLSAVFSGSAPTSAAQAGLTPAPSAIPQPAPVTPGPTP